MWLRAGPAQPGTVLGDICDLDVVGLGCNAKSEETLNKDLKRKGLKEKCLSAAGSPSQSTANKFICSQLWHVQTGL